MTDQPDAERDEIASAHLDGELDDVVELDAELAARLEQFRSVSELVSASVHPLDDDARESMLAAALAAADQNGGLAAAAPADLGAARNAKRRIWLPPPAVAAAVVIVVALVGIGLIVSGHRSGSSGNAASDLAAKGTATEHAGAALGTGQAAAPATGSSALSDLGSFTDPKSLATALRTISVTRLQAVPGTGDRTATTAPKPEAPPSTLAAELGSSSTTVQPTASQDTNAVTTTSNASINRCDAAIRATDPTLGDPLAVARAVVDGRPVLVYSHPVQDPSVAKTATRITVADLESCRILLAVQR